MAVVCEGECGSQHEHSAIFSQDSAWFVVNKDTKAPLPFPVHRKPHHKLPVKLQRN